MNEWMDNLRVILVAPRNPLNVGAVARAMSNFGALHLRVVAPYERAFREAKSAVGAEELLQRAEEFASVKEAVADCTLVVGTTAIGNREIKLPLRDLEVGGKGITRRMAGSRVALLFGSEKWGLSNESVSFCHWLLHIPTRTEHYSMNLGQAVAVCLWELRRSEKIATAAAVERERRGEAKKKPGTLPKTMALRVTQPPGNATAGTLEMITEVMLENLFASGYIPPRGRVSAEEKLRRMLRRFELKQADAEVLLGMMRKIAWKLAAAKFKC